VHNLLKSICKNCQGRSFMYIQFHVLKFVGQLKYMELICLEIICSGDMKYTYR